MRTLAVTIQALQGEVGVGRGAPMGPNGLRHFEQSIGSGRFPHLAALADDPAGPAGRSAVDPGRLEQRFQLGLQALIDGAFRAWAYPDTYSS